MIRSMVCWWFLALGVALTSPFASAEDAALCRDRRTRRALLPQCPRRNDRRRSEQHLGDGRRPGEAGAPAAASEHQSGLHENHGPGPGALGPA